MTDELPPRAGASKPPAHPPGCVPPRRRGDCGEKARKGGLPLQDKGSWAACPPRPAPPLQQRQHPQPGGSAAFQLCRPAGPRAKLEEYLPVGKCPQCPYGNSGGEGAWGRILTPFPVSQASTDPPESSPQAL